MIKITSGDRFFSLCVRERANWTCERCGTYHQPPTTALHCAHWHSRGNWSVRFDPSNALALCYGCHQYTSVNRETEHRPLMLKVFGELELDRVATEKNRPATRVKKFLPEIAKHYRQELERMQRLRANGETGRIEFERWEP